MAKEIEKKFLVKYIPKSEPVRVSQIKQGYLSTGIEHEVRISNRLHLTVKSGFGLTREENIYDISQEVYDALLPLTLGKRISKERRVYDIGSGLFAELDIYKGKNIWVMTVEVEFESEDDAHKFVAPDWFGADVSDKLEYKNSILAC
jgi:CYTH domain-containing protein